MSTTLHRARPADSAAPLRAPPPLELAARRPAAPPCIVLAPDRSPALDDESGVGEGGGEGRGKGDAPGLLVPSPAGTVSSKSPRSPRSPRSPLAALFRRRAADGSRSPRPPGTGETTYELSLDLSTRALRLDAACAAARHPPAAYTVAAEHASARAVGLVLRDGAGRACARLTTDARGTELRAYDGAGGQSRSALVCEPGGVRVVALDGASAWQWAESAGLALLVALPSRAPLAKLHRRVFGRDRLVLLPGPAQDAANVPAVLLGAAKIWFDRQAGRDFRLA